MIVTIQHIRLRANKNREFLQTWNSLIGSIRETDGCFDCRMYQEKTDQNTLLLYSTWQSQASLRIYLRSLTCSILNGAINLLAEESQSNVYLDSFVDDSEYIGVSVVKQVGSEISRPIC